MTKKTCIFYVTTVDISENTGQGVHVQEVVSCLENNPELEFLFFGPEPARTIPLADSPHMHFIPFPRKSFLRYWWFQFQLFLALVKNLPKDKSRTTLYVRYSPTMLAPILLKKLFGVSLVVELAGLVLDEIKQLKKPNWLVYRGIAVLARLNYTIADRMVVMVSTVRDWLIENYSLAEAQIELVPNGVDTNLFQARPKRTMREQYDFPPFPYLVGFLGHLAEYYGVKYLVAASDLLLEKRQDVGFVIIGHGPEYENLVNQVKDLGLTGHYWFTGQVNHEDVPDYISGCDVMTIPKTRQTLQSQGSSSIKLYEYLACERPIVGSRGHGHLFIEENNLGMLFEPENVEAFASVLDQILNLSETEQAEMGKRGREYVHKYHSWANISRRLIEICREVQAD